MWKETYSNILNSKNMQDLQGFLKFEYENYTIYPSKENLFRCFKECKEEDLKVIIIGQDPYHEPGEANGLAFSVNEGIKLPPSLRNIYKEIEIEFNENTKKDGDLQYLSNQGVLLLNKYLSVRAHEALSHKNEIYDKLFDEFIKEIEEKEDKVIVYLLWGREAQKIEKNITNPKHFVLKANHPSPLSANRGGWFNSNIFIKCNEILKNNDIIPINWVKK